MRSVPGAFGTEMNRSLLDDPVKYKEFVAQIPMGRWGELDELAGAVVFLASEASSYMTGTPLFVDGGWIARLGLAFAQVQFSARREQQMLMTKRKCSVASFAPSSLQASAARTRHARRDAARRGESGVRNPHLHDAARETGSAEGRFRDHTIKVFDK